MSTGSISLDILLNKILTDAISGGNESIRAIQKRYPSLSEKEAHEILAMVSATAQSNDDSAELVVTAPPSFALKTKPTKVTVREMLMGARKSILITGYSLSDYFAELVDCVIQKSQEGVLVKFFVNDIESQKAFDRLCCYKGKFLRIYNYPKQEDKMSALHAKVRGVETSILSTCNNYKPRWKSNGVFFNRFFGGFVLRATLKSNFVASAMSCSIIEISLLRL